MKFTLPIKDWIGISTTIILITLSWASNTATTDKNNALVNQKLDTLILNQTTTTGQISTITTSLNNHEVRITVLERTATPLLSQAELTR